MAWGQLSVGVWVPPALPGAASLLAQGRSPTRELLQASQWIVVLVPPWDREGTGTYTAVPTSAPAPLLPAQQGNRKGTPPHPHRPDNRPHSVWGSHTHTKAFVLLFPLWGKPLIQVLPIPTSGHKATSQKPIEDESLQHLPRGCRPTIRVLGLP